MLLPAAMRLTTSADALPSTAVIVLTSARFRDVWPAGSELITLTRLDSSFEVAACTSMAPPAARACEPVTSRLAICAALTSTDSASAADAPVPDEAALIGSKVSRSTPAGIPRAVATALAAS